MNWIVLLAIGFFILYFSSGQYLREFFANNVVNTESRNIPNCREPDCQKSYDIKDTSQMIAPSEMPYETQPIDSVDDYEYNLVFQNEGNREKSKKKISDAMFRYPLDWSVQPPSSAIFQQGLEAFENQQRKESDPNNPPIDLSQFNSISGQDMVPPNMDAIDAEEKRELAMYSPEDLDEEREKEKCKKETPLEKVQKLVKKIYDKRGEVAVIRPSKQGNNVWEISEVYKKDEPIVWEDEVPEPSRSEARGEQRIQVPRVVNDMASQLDPFFEPRSTTRMSKNDYTKWTPGLERMFAPTYPQSNWY